MAWCGGGMGKVGRQQARWEGADEGGVWCAGWRVRLVSTCECVGLAGLCYAGEKREEHLGARGSELMGLGNS